MREKAADVDCGEFAQQKQCIGHINNSHLIQLWNVEVEVV